MKHFRAEEIDRLILMKFIWWPIKSLAHSCSPGLEFGTDERAATEVFKFKFSFTINALLGNWSVVANRFLTKKDLLSGCKSSYRDPKFSELSSLFELIFPLFKNLRFPLDVGKRLKIVSYF